ncbi:hypothetical protein FRC00_010894 [Tulasnella sp. 408]|nr:hypothetical protein FRC00_010894 [Tulasnella sp. 408]
MVLNDWIRGKIPYFVRPPDFRNYLKKREADATHGASTSSVTARGGEDEETQEATGAVGGAERSDDGQAKKPKREPRPLGVSQYMGGVKTRPEFFKNDRFGAVEKDEEDVESFAEEDEGIDSASSAEEGKDDVPSVEAEEEVE